jgi:hypothetical protein
MAARSGFFGKVVEKEGCESAGHRHCPRNADASGYRSMREAPIGDDRRIEIQGGPYVCAVKAKLPNVRYFSNFFF